MKIFKEGRKVLWNDFAYFPTLLMIVCTVASDLEAISQAKIENSGNDRK